MNFLNPAFMVLNHLTFSSESCGRLASHVAECTLLRFRRATVNVPWFDKPCAYYDAILPLRVLLLKMHNPKVIFDLIYISEYYF